MWRVLLVLLLSLPSLVRAQEPWRRPPPEVQRVLDAPELPALSLSPAHDRMLLVTSDPMLRMADLARPMLRLGGVRVDPATNAPHAEGCARSLTVRGLEPGTERPVPLPEGACLSRLRWSHDGARYAFANRVADGLELWVSTVDGAPKRVKKIRINGIFGDELSWMPDSRHLLVRLVPEGRGAPPQAPETPTGPYAVEAQGSAPISTYEARDLLRSPQDAELFAWYGSSQLALVDAETRKVTRLGGPGLYVSARPSPDGRHLLVERLRAPFSYRVAWSRFARDVEVWDGRGAQERVLARLPVADAVPIDGVPVGMRSVGWAATSPATLVWAEALDGGDLDEPAPHRDQILALDAPFDGTPRELWRATERVDGWWWSQDGGLWIEEWSRARRWSTTWYLASEGAAPRRVHDLSTRDRYGDPGWPVWRRLPNGAVVAAMDGGRVYFAGQGASPDGDRPFLDRLDPRTGAVERLFRSEPSVLERFVEWVDPAAGRFLTVRESAKLVPNYLLTTLGGPTGQDEPGEAQYGASSTPITRFEDPTPELRRVQKRLVTYTRADGVPLSFTLYLPPDHVEGTRLPTVLMAYPLEYSDARTAGQVSGSEQTFVRFSGATPLFLLLSGYAVLANTSVPVIGDPETAYDSFVEQVVSSATAAVDRAVELGVTDRERVGVWGHSHGALMVATLLAHSDLFRAGIARSGAYNHTIRPFGFQNEHRTLWEARDTYLRLSPLMFAPQINEPLLLVHGALDQNPGTVPLQSEKLFDAVRGVGGTTRLVLLPHEGHGYASREAIEQVLAEQLDWMDRWVKNAPPRAGAAP